MRKSLFLMMLIILSLYLCSFTDNKTNISTKSSDRYYDGNDKVDIILKMNMVIMMFSLKKVKLK